ncbi:MAG TPA: radical SAM protein [Desulfotignum sp.]|nr:radical SAM protein [Desulfotignum sp.]
MLLLFPPVAKPCEPPAGVAYLSSALRENSRDCHVVDANVQGLGYLIRQNLTPEDSWSARALKNRESILADLQNPDLYASEDRYHQRVYDLNRLLSLAVDQTRYKITLSDYTDRHLSPLRSQDLLKSADTFRSNPFYPYFEEMLRPVLSQWDSPWVGISLCYLNQALVSFALAGWIQYCFPEKKIILGGGLVSSWMSRPDFNHPFTGLITYMIPGEGEIPLLDLLGKPSTTRRHYVPDYSFARKRDYLAPAWTLPFRSTIGCYWRKCRFCPEKAESRPYSTRRADVVLADVMALVRRFRPDAVHFIDNAMTPAFLRALAAAGSKIPFAWYGFVRFEKDLADLEFCFQLKRSGCYMLKLGLESGDQSVLDQMNKGTDLVMVSRILENLHQAGIFTYVYLLFGTRFEDRQSALKTLTYVRGHQKYMDYLNLAVFNLPRYSEDATDLETQEFYNGDLSLYLNFTHPSGWDRRQIKRFLDKTFKKQVAIGSRLRKNPAFFSSNHAMFFNPAWLAAQKNGTRSADPVLNRFLTKDDMA